MSSRGRGEEQRGEGKGEEQSELGWTKGLCRTTFSTGSCQEPILKGLEGPQSDNILTTSLLGAMNLVSMREKGKLNMLEDPRHYNLSQM